MQYNYIRKTIPFVFVLIYFKTTYCVGRILCWILCYYLKHSGVSHIMISIVTQTYTECTVFKDCKLFRILASET